MHRSISILAREVAQMASAFEQQRTGHAPKSAVVSQDGDVTGAGPAGNSQLRVLVADDYSDTAESLSVLLKIWGHQVWIARDGPAALDMAVACQADVVLLDIGMPNLDGCQVARQLRRQARFEDTLLIAITGWADQAHRLLGEEAGFDLYLIKPVEPATLEVLLVLEQDRLAHSSTARAGKVEKRQQSLGTGQSRNKHSMAIA